MTEALLQIIAVSTELVPCVEGALSSQWACCGCLPCRRGAVGCGGASVLLTVGDVEAQVQAGPMTACRVPPLCSPVMPQL